MTTRESFTMSSLDRSSFPENAPVSRYTSERYTAEEWKLEGICRTADPEEWFPEIGSHPVMAKRMCALCPVMDNCLADALTRGEYWGVWGGLSSRERRGLRQLVRAQVRAEKYHKK